MSGSESFRDLIRRVRAGDDGAAAELVRQYEPEIRRAVRVRLTDPELRRLVDSLDICQSVLGSFFARAALGQYQLEEPRQLLRLLISMARNKVADLARRETAQRRDRRRDRPLDGAALDLPDRRPSPGASVAAKDLLDSIHARMSERERAIAGGRAAGHDWTELARRMGSSPDALRKRLSRAIDRVAGEIGLDGVVLEGEEGTGRR